FDDLVLAMPLEKSLDFLDVGAEERRLFGRIRYLDYSTVLCTVRGLPRDGFYLLQQHAEDPASRGHPVAFHHRYPETDVYTFYAYGGPAAGPADIQRLLHQDVARMGGQVEMIHHQQRWAYFPHVGSEDLRTGYFQRLDAIQGRKHTYYLGSLLGFELVE